VSAVLHHDVAQDVWRARHVIMQAHTARRRAGSHWWPSSIQVVTPFNALQFAPPDLGRR